MRAVVVDDDRRLVARVARGVDEQAEPLGQRIDVGVGRIDRRERRGVDDPGLPVGRRSSGTASAPRRSAPRRARRSRRATCARYATPGRPSSVRSVSDVYMPTCEPPAPGSICPCRVDDVRLPRAADLRRELERRGVAIEVRHHRRAVGRDRDARVHADVGAGVVDAAADLRVRDDHRAIGHAVDPLPRLVGDAAAGRLRDDEVAVRLTRTPRPRSSRRRRPRHR